MKEVVCNLQTSFISSNLILHLMLISCLSSSHFKICEASVRRFHSTVTFISTRHHTHILIYFDFDPTRPFRIQRCHKSFVTSPFSFFSWRSAPALRHLCWEWQAWFLRNLQSTLLGVISRALRLWRDHCWQAITHWYITMMQSAVSSNTQTAYHWMFAFPGLMGIASTSRQTALICSGSCTVTTLVQYWRTAPFFINQFDLVTKTTNQLLWRTLIPRLCRPQLFWQLRK